MQKARPIARSARPAPGISPSEPPVNPLDGTWQWYPDTDELFVDERWCLIQGVSADTDNRLPRDLWMSRVHPEDQTELEKRLGELKYRVKDHIDFELRCRQGDGRWVWLLIRGRSVAAAPRFVDGVLQDITTRKHQEASLREDGYFLGRSEQVTGVGNWQVDLVNQQVTWSDETCRIHGRLPGFMLTFDEAVAYFTTSAQPAFRACIDQAIKSRESFDIELPLNRADGKRILVRCLGAVEYIEDKAVRLSGAVQDVTERTVRLLEEVSRSNSELERANERLSLATSSGGIGIWDLDVTTGEYIWDSHMKVLYGLQGTGSLSMNAERWLNHVHEEDRQRLRALWRDVILDQGSAELYFRILRADGITREIYATVRVIRDVDEKAQRMVGTNQDVTEARRLSREMTWRATHDALTGLANRAEFETILHQVHRDGVQSGQAHALLFIDLDQFKIVNDSCGHAAGDELLKEVSAIFEQSVRADDMVARIGGDEFAIILKTSTVAHARQLANAICKRVNEYRFLFNGQRYRIGASIGLVPVGEEWPDASAVIRAADSACYAAKEAGRNRVHIGSESDQAMQVRKTNTAWARRLETALDNDGFELYVQRIDTVGPAQLPVARNAEVLLRLVDDDGDRILPGVFMGAAERFNLIYRIDQWVLSRLVDWMQNQAELSEVGTLWVNLSGLSFGDPSFQRDTLERLRSAGSDVCQSLCFEITETAAVRNLTHATHFIHALQEHGVRVALDDFGAGASSFGYLKSLPVDYLKIDGQFVRNLQEDPLDAAAVRCFVEVAGIMGIKTVAEFVETPEVLAQLQEIGVDYVQGWLLHHPGPIDQLYGEQRAHQHAMTGAS